MPVITAQLDMAQPLHPGCARLQAQFGPPAQVWVAHTADELLSVLAQVEAAARAGAWCLGAVAYEAAAALAALELDAGVALLAVHGGHTPTLR